MAARRAGFPAIETLAIEMTEGLEFGLARRAQDAEP